MPEFLRHILAVASKEFLQLRRDRLTLGMVVGLPLAQILLFGYAINFDVRQLPTGVVDLANTSLSRAIVSNAAASQLIDPVRYLNTEAELELAIRKGELSVGIIIPADLERRIQTRDQPAGQILVNGTDPTVGNIARQLAQLPPTMRPTMTPENEPNFAVRTFYNPERRSAINTIPALTGVILHMTMVLFTSMAIVRERERGNLEFLITTPIRTSWLMIGKILPYILIGLIQITIILLAGVWLFSVPIVGSLIELYLACFIYIAATLALGLVISTFANTQFQAMQLMVFTLLPAILLSGFIFPFEGIPESIQWIGLLFPLTLFIDIVRGILLRGAHLSELTPYWVGLLVFFAVAMSVAVARFHKRLD